MKKFSLVDLESDIWILSLPSHYLQAFSRGFDYCFQPYNIRTITIWDYLACGFAFSALRQHTQM